MDEMSLKELSLLALKLRKKTLRVIAAGKAGHTGGDMSAMDILTILYFRVLNTSPETADDPERDRFVLSKGHVAEGYYTVLSERGYFPYDELLTGFSRFGSPFIGHPNNKLPGVEMNSGSLGHGLSVSSGMALAGKLDGASFRVYTLMGDGELAEGSVWEAAMAAGHYKLDNLCAIVDRNGLQISGKTEDVMSAEPIEGRFAAFGWNVLRVNGNDMIALDAAFGEAAAYKGKPTIIIADTVKGYGSPMMENKAEWHHKVPTEEELQYIFADIEQKEREIANA